MHKTTTATLLGLLLSAGAAAHAQGAGDATAADQKPVAIKLGAFFPSNGDIKNGVGKTFFAAGAEYAFIKKGSAATTVPLLYVDYAGKSKNDSVTDGATTVSGNLRVSYTGVGVGIRSGSGSGEAKSVSPYFGAGIGIYFTKAKLSLTATDSTGNTSDSSSQSKTNLGFKVNAGVNLGQTFFLEAAYQYPGKVVDTNLSGFNILGGVRF